MIYDLQKASFLKRISAFILDFILIIVLSVGMILLISSVLQFNKQQGRYDALCAPYEQKYTDFVITDEEYDKLTKEEQIEYDEQLEVLIKEIDAEIKADKRISKQYTLIISYGLMMASIGILFAYVILYFIVPIIFKNGQTVGKKIFGICLMKINGVKISNVNLFVRSILGKYTIEMMFPLYIIFMIMLGIIGGLGTIILLGLVITQIIVMIVSKTNSPIHDVIAGTICVDMNSQMIFDSEQAMIKYKEEAHKKHVRKSTY